MVHEAETEEQLTKWLTAYYNDINPSNVSKVEKISSMMFLDQPSLDSKLKTKHEKGLRYAAELAGDLSKRKYAEDSSDDEDRDEPVKLRKLGKLPGAKRFVLPMPVPETKKKEAPSPKSRDSFPVTPSSRAATPFPPRPPPPSGKKKSGDLYALNDKQKAFLKRAREEGLELVYDQNNPKNAGSASYDRYESYKAGRTVSQVIKLGGKSADIPYDYSRGYVYFPHGGEYASFRFINPDEPSLSSISSKPSHFSQTHKPTRPVSSSTSQESSNVMKSKRATTSAWQVTDEDMKETSSKDREEEIEETFEGQPGAREWQAARHALEAGDYEEASDYVAVAHKKASGKLLKLVSRLRGVLHLHSMSPPKSALCVSASSKSSTEMTPNKSVKFPEHCPRLRGQDSEYRDLAKETRLENHLRHEPRGVAVMFDSRLKEMLDDLVDELTLGHSQQSQQQQQNLSEHVARTEIDFRGTTESFRLHKRSALPGNAKFLDETLRPFKGGNIDGLVELIKTTDKGTKTPELLGVNKYGKGGCSALTLAARGGRDDLVEELLRTGAEAEKAVDGAIYLSERKANTDWIMSLFRSLNSFPSLVSPTLFIDLVRHARKKGDTALLVAVNLCDVAAAKQLLDWGALVSDPQQRRNSDQAPCFDVATEKNTPAMIALLSEHRQRQETSS